MNGIDTTRGDDVETVRSRISEVIAWCKTRIDKNRPREWLRSPEISPHPLEDGRKCVVESVNLKRHILLQWPAPNPARDLAGGRLLIYEPDVNLAHGLEELETNGYVDVDNTPPWDTWVAYLYEGERNFLLSWTPPEFLQLVNGGIQVCPEECILWLDEQDLCWASLLHNCGLRYSDGDKPC